MVAAIGWSTRSSSGCREGHRPLDQPSFTVERARPMRLGVSSDVIGLLDTPSDPSARGRGARPVAGVATGAPFSGPDLGAYTKKTYTPDPDSGVSWTEQLARDERDAGRLAEVTQHYYVGDSPGQTTAQQAIS